jgi:hypothetical protein
LLRPLYVFDESGRNSGFGFAGALLPARKLAVGALGAPAALKAKR